MLIASAPAFRAPPRSAAMRLTSVLHGMSPITVGSNDGITGQAMRGKLYASHVTSRCAHQLMTAFMTTSGPAAPFAIEEATVADLHKAYLDGRTSASAVTQAVLPSKNSGSRGTNARFPLAIRTELPTLRANKVAGVGKSR